LYSEIAKEAVMRSLQLLTLVLLATAAKGDTFGLSNFEGHYSSLAIAETGLTFGFTGESNAVYISGHPNLICDDPCSFEIATGPLISSTDNSWTFAGGGEVLAGGRTMSWIPDGYDSCAAAGLEINWGDGRTCEVGGANVTGHFTGITILTADDIGNGLTSFSISGPVEFDISQPLATYLGLSTGRYFGGYGGSGFALTFAEPLRADGTRHATDYIWQSCHGDRSGSGAKHARAAGPHPRWARLFHR